jgi:RNA polymerase sigma-70 factor (ECF subfamily)
MERREVFIFEGRHTVTERALTQSDLLMTAGNEDTLEAAVREHARLVYRIAYSVSRNHHDAEDATQETFMRVLRYRRKLAGIRDPKTWIARLAWRVSTELAKRQRRRSFQRTEVSDALPSQSALASAEEVATNQQMSDLLATFIAALPEALRDAIRLSTVQDLTPAEIAQVLETTEASVRSRLFRARQMLKRKFIALETNHGTAQ